ncbi:MAG: MogA/MoaB family molybdenum cofactor biosynthesis protein [Thermoprotei archaeon]|nr:MogA/MoaB family molybdenum cofactor biosynthesis protein [Thermoprotei archaeon]
MSSREEHTRYAPKEIRFLVVIVSTSRSRNKRKADISGELALSLLKEEGFKVVNKVIIPDDPHKIDEVITKYVNKVDVILFSGGTGISPTDTTPDVILRRAEKVIPGFGELFRYITYKKLGTVAMATRACAGVIGKTIVFSIPGSPHAVELAIRKLIAPEIRHMVAHVRGLA